MIRNGVEEMNSKKKIFDIVSAEDLFNRLSLREALRICADVMTENELAMLLSVSENKAEHKEEAVKQIPLGKYLHSHRGKA